MTAMLLMYIRRFFQFAVAAAALMAGIGMAVGWSMSGIEKFCPFGGIETGYSLITQKQFSCTTGEYNISLFLTLIMLTLLTRKSFCSWICPVGTVSEWLTVLGKKLQRHGKQEKKRIKPGMYALPHGLDRFLRWLRLPVLLVILFFTYRTGELVFRAYDPYYVMFSANGYEVYWWSYVILAIILAAAIIIPMAWCRYLCPLGGVLWPFSRYGWLRITRQEKTCKNCGTCDAVCPHSILVSKGAEVRSGECTLCLECIHACGMGGELGLHLVAGRFIKMPEWVVPTILIGMILLGLVCGSMIAFPSFTKEYKVTGITAMQPRTVNFVITGLRCVDTAKRAASQLDGIPGVRRFTAFASRHQAEIIFDENSTDIAVLHRAIERPVYNKESDQYLFHQFKVVEIDGQKLY